MIDQVIFAYWLDRGMRFGVKVWRADEIDAKFLAHWHPGEAALDEIGSEVLADLRKDGYIDFEEGWMRLFTNIGDGVAFIYEKAKDNHSDYEFDLNRMREAHHRADEATEKLKALQTTLRDALGEKAQDMRATVSQSIG